jgi:alanine dehydrogenase
MSRPKRIFRDVPEGDIPGLQAEFHGRLVRSWGSPSDPTYVVDGVVHYCVANMPGVVARTSTFALNNATLPFVLTLADRGWREALRRDPHLLNGLNVCDGRVTCNPVAKAQDLPYTPAQAILDIRHG